MARKKKSSNKTAHTIAYILSVMVAIALIAISYLTYKTVMGMNIFPAKYMNILLYSLIGVNVFSGLIAFFPGINILNKSLQILICGVLAAGLMFVNVKIPSYLGRFERMFNSVPEEGTLLMSIYVPTDSEISSVKDCKDARIGVLSDKNSEYLDYSYKVITRELNGNSIEPVPYNDVYKLAEDLQNKVIDGILINQTYAGFIAENADFSGFNYNNKIIYTIEQKIKLNYETNVVGNITSEPFVVAISGNDTWNYDEMDPSKNIARSDVNMVVAINPVNKKIFIVSIPRDSYVPLWGDTSAMDKLTHATIYGIDTWEKTVNDLLGININYFVRLNFQSFVNVVDALGGLDFDNPSAVSIPTVYFDPDGTMHGIIYDYPEGRIHVNGFQALGYVRERYAFSEGDIARNKHQAMVLKVLVDKLTEVSVITKVDALLDAVEGTFLTDIDINQIYALVQMQLDDMATWDIESYAVTGYNDMRTSYAMGNGDVEIEEEVEVEVPIVDEDGNPVLDEEGNQMYETVIEKQTTTQEATKYSVVIPDTSTLNEARSKLQNILNGN